MVSLTEMAETMSGNMVKCGFFRVPVLRLGVLLGWAVVAVCGTAGAGEGEALLDDVRQLYDEGQYQQALIQWLEVADTYPETEGLQKVKQDLLTALKDRGVPAAKSDADISDKRMALEILEKSSVPTTYGLEDYIEPMTREHKTPQSPIRKVLEQPVTIHLKGADLSTIIAALSEDENINIIADQGLGKGQLLDIELDRVPLSEVLDYVSRNFNVRFYLGRSIIWATSPDRKIAAPLETRIYRLHKGVQFYGDNWDPLPGKDNNSQNLQVMDAVASQPTILASQPSYIENILKAFVPQVEGSSVLFDATTHSLVVRNTAENLELTEQILDIVDITPPQVLIEARFIEVTVSDLLELGLDWVLDSAAPLSKGVVLQDGRWVETPRTEVSGGSGIEYPALPYQGLGEKEFPASPRPGFGDPRGDWSPDTASHGLNITFRGILTQPEFRAVLHALEISGKGKTLSVPRVTTLNNTPAKLRDGSDLLYYDEFEAKAFTLLDDNGKKYSVSALMPKGEPELAELGITLVAVPSVGEDLLTISLLLKPTISKLETFQYYTDQSATNAFSQLEIKLPTISRRQIETKVSVGSGETVVMGGLIETAEQDTLHKVPVLGSIPVIGRLFRRTDNTKIRKNLLIFVTATVISERGEALLPRRGPVRQPIVAPRETE